MNRNASFSVGGAGGSSFVSKPWSNSSLNSDDVPVLVASKYRDDVEVQHFFRETAVVADTLLHLVEADAAGFNDVLYVKCQQFLKSHERGVNVRKTLRSVREKERDRLAMLRAHPGFISKLSIFLEDPRSSTAAAIFFFFVALFVIISVTTTMISTLPAYNPLVQSKYVNLWNAVELSLGGLFTFEAAARFVCTAFDRSMPTSTSQNIVRFFSKPANLIDIVSIVPTYAQLMVPPSSRIITGTLKTVRLLRIFKVLRFYKPVRMLQKALIFAGKGLLAPMLFLITTLVFVSAGAYYSEHGKYDSTLHEYLLDQDPVCAFEPSSFLTFAQRNPGEVFNVSFQLTTQSPVSIWDTLPPSSSGSGGAGSSSSAPPPPSTADPNSASTSFGASSESKTGKIPQFSSDTAIDTLQCPLSEAQMASIPQCTWWSIATMSTCGFGDFSVVTGWGRILAVFGIVAGVILNAMPIAVVDASFVTTLQTEEEQESQETVRKKQQEASVKQQKAPRDDDNDDDENNDKGGTIQKRSSEMLDPLCAALLMDTNASFLGRSVEMEERRCKQAEVYACTPSSQAERLLAHLEQLSKHSVIDLANPSDNVLYLLDQLLEAAITNTAVETARWINKQMSGGGVEGGGGMWSIGLPILDTWVPELCTNVPIARALVQSNVLFEAQTVAALSGWTEMVPPTGEPRECVVESSVLSLPVRWSLGSNLNCNNDQRGATMRSLQHMTILDDALFERMMTKRSEAVVRAQLIHRASDSDDDNDKSRDDAQRRASPTHNRRSGNKLHVPAVCEKINMSAIMKHHFDIVRHCAWGRLHSLLIPRRQPAALITSTGYEVEPLTMQVLRFCKRRLRWFPVLPYVVENRGLLGAPADVSYRYRCRIGTSLNRMAAAASNTDMFMTKDQWQEVDRQTFLSSLAETNELRRLLTALRTKSHYASGANHDTDGSSTGASSASENAGGPQGTTQEKRLSVRARQEAEKRAARSTKAKKDAETRELLDALSSEKKEAFAVLQTLDMDVTGVELSDRLSLLTLASIAVEKLEKERHLKHDLVAQRFSTMLRIAAEEQEQRIVLQDGDVIALFGAPGVCPRLATENIIRSLPSSREEVIRHIVSSGMGKTSSTVSQRKQMDGLYSVTGRALLYAFTSSS